MDRLSPPLNPVEPVSRWLAAIHHSPVAIALLAGSDRIVIDATPGLARMLGIPREVLCGQAWGALPAWIPGNDWPQDTSYPDGPFLMQYRRSGLRAIRDASCVIEQAEDGDESFAVITLQDVTDLLGTDRALLWQYDQLERARFEASSILDAADEAIVLISPDHRIVVANRVFLELVRIDAGDLLGVPVGQIRDRLSAVFTNLDLGQLLISDESDGDLHTAGATTGEAVARSFCIDSQSIIGKDGFHYGRLFTLRDITRQLESDRLKDEFAANISHELRTPLTSIAGFVELLLDPERPQTPESIRRYLSVIHRNVTGLIDQVSQLLDFSRIQSGVIEIDARPVDIRTVIDRVMSLLTLRATNRNVTIDVPSNVPNALVDPERLFQIVFNLVSNAIKFTAEGDAIRIEVRQEQKEILIQVADTGIGLAPHEQESIFSRFYQVPTKGKSSKSGTGLGLPIARMLAELMGGSISVESALHVGSVFTVRLPQA